MAAAAAAAAAAASSNVLVRVFRQASACLKFAFLF